MINLVAALLVVVALFGAFGVGYYAAVAKYEEKLRQLGAKLQKGTDSLESALEEQQKQQPKEKGTK